MLDRGLQSNHVFGIIGEMADLFIVVPRESLDGLERIPIRNDLKISDVVADLPQHLDATIARDSRNPADPFLVQIMRVVIDHGCGSLAMPDSRDQSSCAGDGNSH